MDILRHRLLFPAILLLMVLSLGVAGYMIVEKWKFIDALFMTVISLTTVGYGETNPLTTNGRIFTMFLLLSGMGVLAYGIGTVTAFFVEGHLSDILRERKMLKRIQRLRDHIILCGYEGEGHYVLEELVKTKTPHVVIARDLVRLKQMFPSEALCLEGDPSKEGMLAQANIERAQVLISAMPTDHENLLVVLSARGMSPRIRIITCVYDRENLHKFQRVGANGTVMGTFIGGLRMVSEAIRPTVVSFLDQMLRDIDKTIRIEEVIVPDADCAWAGKPLSEIDFPARTGLVVIAVKSIRTQRYIYNPRGNYVLNAGDVLIVIGETSQTLEMKRLLGHEIAADGEEPEEEVPAAPGERA
ncbi:MAG: NAD-binding protein [Candidatus Tectomicrobia bacterium]|uniref:NAD-binding protein n=1 Tax=Tectimicrobiota bacterium TaxID=2528274 RepID=A0A932I1I3_UNCTE|nr:NAD-binding protein [Candidatus Tectomicrobia bacterium]